MFIPDYVSEILQILNAHHYEAYVVGGAVRNHLLHLPAHDYDVTTNALPQQLKEVFQNYATIDTGIQHGTVTVLINHHPVEITTYRKDSAYTDHRHPSSVTFTSELQEDCKRRDFTINAMCYHPSCGILDFFSGQQDLNNHILRCIGNPEERFEEDALRILRALRFAARLNFTIEENTSRTLIQKKETLSYVSIERITSEWMGILESGYPCTILKKYRSVIEVFLPEIKEYTESAYSSVLDTLEKETSGSAYVRMALFLRPLQDISKARLILQRMKCSNAYMSSVLNLLQVEDMPVSNRINMRYLLAALTVDFDMYLHYCSTFQATDSAQKLYTEVTSDTYAYTLSQLKITGKDLLALGYKGKEIGETLHTLLEMVMQEKIHNTKEELLQALQSTI